MFLLIIKCKKNLWYYLFIYVYFANIETNMKTGMIKKMLDSTYFS